MCDRRKTPSGLWVRHAVSSQVRSVFAGLRVSSIDEQTSLTSQLQQVVSQTEFVDGFDGSTNSTTDIVNDDDAQRGRYTVRMNNDLFGVHLGGEITEKYDEWSWGLRGKIGGLVNLIDRRSLIESRLRVRNDSNSVEEQRVDEDNNPLFIELDLDGNGDPIEGTGTITTDSNNSVDNGIENDPLNDTTTFVTFDALDQRQGEKLTDEMLSLLLEAGIFGKYQLRPNLQVRIGYDVLLYSGVAFAPENIGFENRFPDLNLNAVALYHGGYAGFETTW